VVKDVENSHSIKNVTKKYCSPQYLAG